MQEVVIGLILALSPGQAIKSQYVGIAESLESCQKQITELMQTLVPPADVTYVPACFPAMIGDAKKAPKSA